MSKTLKGLIYVSGWIGSWALISSIINAGFLTVNLYTEDSKGKLLTFFISGMISLIGASSLYKEVFSNERENKSP